MGCQVSSAVFIPPIRPSSLQAADLRSSHLTSPSRVSAALALAASGREKWAAPRGVSAHPEFDVYPVGAPVASPGHQETRLWPDLDIKLGRIQWNRLNSGVCWPPWVKPQLKPFSKTKPHPLKLSAQHLAGRQTEALQTP